VEVVLYTRAGCHLCDVARGVILAQRAKTSFAFEEVDIETSDELTKDYGIRIPVVTVSGIERFEVSVDPAAFAALLS
jgi:glutaredoxin